MATKFTIPRGTYDILPNESYKWEFIQNTYRVIMKEFGFKEIVTPIFERSELFERNVGDTSDIVEKEMYKFNDKKGRNFALRPEGTAPVVRSFVENNLNREATLSKLYYMGPMFRYDRPQKGRYRQFYQYGIEAIGSSHPYMDAEVIAIGYLFLKRLGLKNLRLEINSIGCSTCTNDYDNALVEYFKPHYEELCSDCKKRLEKNPKRVLDCKVPSCKEIAKEAPSMLDYLDDDCKTKFQAVQKYLKAMEIPYVVNPTIVRGLDYYSNTAFEIINDNLGAQSTMLGGGRYDGLVKQVGGKGSPGIGFAGGFERLIISMEDENLSFGDVPNPEAYLVTLGENAENFGITLLNKLRSNNIKVAFDIDKSSMKAQMKAAGKSGARFAIIIGDDDIEQNVAVVKDLQDSNQVSVSLDQLIAYLKA